MVSFPALSHLYPYVPSLTSWWGRTKLELYSCTRGEINAATSPINSSLV